jgi:hypothetical protein
MKSAGLEAKLGAFGLHLRGILRPDAEEAELLKVEVGSEVSIALVGNIGSSYWPVFSRSPEYRDGQPDSLDRWSRGVAQQVAEVFQARAIFPFEGPPYYPFLQWAKRADALSQSPLGLMIHPQYGLWHSYRFALLIPQAIDQQPISLTSPCESCESQPCLITCPVNAFGNDGYDVDSCAGYLNQNAHARCHQEGCLARLACPIGENYRYESAQHRFHLRAFIDAR